MKQYTELNISRFNHATRSIWQNLSYNIIVIRSPVNVKVPVLQYVVQLLFANARIVFGQVSDKEHPDDEPDSSDCSRHVKDGLEKKSTFINVHPVEHNTA